MLLFVSYRYTISITSLRFIHSNVSHFFNHLHLLSISISSFISVSITLSSHLSSLLTIQSMSLSSKNIISSLPRALSSSYQEHCQVSLSRSSKHQSSKLLPIFINNARKQTQISKMQFNTDRSPKLDKPIENQSFQPNLLTPQGCFKVVSGCHPKQTVGRPQDVIPIKVETLMGRSTSNPQACHIF